MIAATTDGRRILVRFPYSKQDVARVKMIPGARWRPEQKEWALPQTMDTCRSLRRVFGDQLQVLPVLAEWARTEIKRANELESFREGIDVDATEDLLFLRVAREAPDLLKAMGTRPYQMMGAAFGVKAKQSILGDEPGLGKTLQTLAMLIESDARTILVGCRRTATRTVWERETLRWTPTIYPWVAQGPRTEREAAMTEFHSARTITETRRMLIVNIEMIRAKRVEVCPQDLGENCLAKVNGQCRHKFEATYDWPFLFQQEWDAIVLDESHNLLASTANYQSKRITQARYGAVMLRRRLKPDGLAVALSGTPFRSNLTKGWGTLNWLRPDVFTSYWNWAGNLFGVEQGRYGKIVGGGAKVPRPLDEAAWDAMLRPYYLKRTKAEVAADLPPIMYAGTPIDPADPESPCYVQIEMEDKQAKAYHQMVADAEADIEGGKILATGILAEITRQRQFANAYGHLDSRNEVSPALPSNKIDWIIDFMQEREGTGLKVVIASSFTEMVELTASTLRKEEFEVLTLTGATSDRKRADLVARFQDPNDSLQVVVINRKAGGESITLDAADSMVVIDPPWLSDDDEQLYARIHRVSRIHQVTIYRLLSVGTIDGWISSLTDAQREVLATADPRKLSDLIREEIAS